MTREVTRRHLLSGGAVSALAALAGCSATTPFVGVRRTETRRIDPKKATTLHIDSKVGDVKIRDADRDDVRAHLVKQSSSIRGDVSDLKLVTQHNDDTLQLRSTGNRQSTLLGSPPSLDMDLTVPRSLRVAVIDADFGDVDVADLSGDMKIHTDAGDVTVARVTDAVTAETRSGDIDAADVDGELSVRTSSGDLSATQVTGPVTAAADTGDIEATDVGGNLAMRTGSGELAATRVTGTVTAEASTGDVTVRDPDRLGDINTGSGEVSVDAPAIADETAVTTDSGDIEVFVGDSLDAEVQAETNTGDISVADVSLSEVTREDEVSDGTLSGTLGDGGPHLRLEASTGDISIQPL